MRSLLSDGYGRPLKQDIEISFTWLWWPGLTDEYKKSKDGKMCLVKARGTEPLQCIFDYETQSFTVIGKLKGRMAIERHIVTHVSFDSLYLAEDCRVVSIKDKSATTDNRNEH